MPGLGGQIIDFKQFMEMQEENVNTDQAQECFDRYVKEHQLKQANIFYHQHREEQWFMDKYDPRQIYKTHNLTLSTRQKLATSFKSKIDDYSKVNLQDSTDYFGFNANQNTVVIRNVPANISRHQVWEIVQHSKGLSFMTVSEPIRDQTKDQVSFVYWLTFEDQESADQAKTDLNNIDTGVSDGEKFYHLTTDSNDAPELPVSKCPPLTNTSISRDKDLAEALIKRFDTQFDIKSNPLFDEHT